ncbi:hypothetical protein AX769_10545 [Frondihabitans sp. PAMC 28766]|nr:hypothetical protein AX769_10545 [Frondihabitans sp. PAMC 28766]
MADLRAIYAGLGFTDVATILNSGNAVFGHDETTGPAPDAAILRKAVQDATGVDSETIVLPADRFRRIAEANPLRQGERDPRRLGVSFAAGPLDPAAADVPTGIEPEELVVTADAVYQWLPNGVLASPVPPGFWKRLGSTVTSRNDATVQKVIALLDARR